MNTLYQLYLASAKEFVRDRMAMFWTLAFPIFFIVVFGIIFSGDNGTSFSIGLAVEDQGPVGADLSRVFQAVDVFNTTEGSRDLLLEQLKQADLRMVIVVPAGVSEAVAMGQPTAIETYFDPSNQTTAQILLTIVERVIDSFDRQLAQTPALLTIQRISITADSLSQLDFLLPGLLAMSLMQLGLFGTAPQLVQLREQQVLRRLGATPLPRSTLLTAQVLYRLTIALAQTLLIIIIGSLVFGVTILGNWLLLLGSVLFGALVFIALGYLLAGLSKTQESVNGITQFFNIPMIFLSGVFFPHRFFTGLDATHRLCSAPDLSGRQLAPGYGWRAARFSDVGQFCCSGRLVDRLLNSGRSLLPMGISCCLRLGKNKPDLMGIYNLRQKFTLSKILYIMRLKIYETN